MKDELLFETCPVCGSQNFTIKNANHITDYDVLECNKCCKLWLRYELGMKPKKDWCWICPLCKANFYHPDWIKFHYEVAHPEVKIIG